MTEAMSAEQSIEAYRAAAEWLLDEGATVAHDLGRLQDEYAALEDRIRAQRELLALCDGPPIDMRAVRKSARDLALASVRTRELPDGPEVPESLGPHHRRLRSLADERELAEEEVAVLRWTEDLLQILLEVVIEVGRYPHLPFERMSLRRRPPARRG